MLDQADWERSSPQWLGSEESSCGFKHQFPTGGKVALHTDVDGELVVGIQRANTMEQGRENL